MIVIDEAAPRREEPQGNGDLDEQLSQSQMAGSGISPTATAAGIVHSAVLFAMLFKDSYKPVHSTVRPFAMLLKKIW